MGIALGCIGLSLTDFCVLTPSEFNMIYEKYIEKEEDAMKGEWERMRNLACLLLSPHVSRKKQGLLRPNKLFPLPWDKKVESQKVVSREEGRARFEKLMKATENNG